VESLAIKFAALKSSPVNNFVIVQVFQTKDDATGIENRSCFAEDICVNVHHQVTSLRILHHETRMFLHPTTQK
jgi:hypothetical protein